MLNRIFGSPNRQQQEWLLLTSACLLKLTVGQTVAGPVYANYMRSAFGLNQSELDLAMLLQCSGTLLAFASGLLHDRWGPRLAVAVGGVASTLASLAVTLAFAFPEPLRGRPWFLWLLMFVYGHAFNYGELVSTTAAMAGFRSDRRGRVMALLDICFNLGAPLSALLHYLIFDNISRPPDSQNAVGAMAVQTALTAAVHAFALAFINQPTLHGGATVSSEPGERTPILLGGPADSDEVKDDDDDPTEAERPSWESLQTPKEFLRATWTGCMAASYLLLLMAFALSMGQSLAVWLNVTTVTRSLGLSGEDVRFFWVPTILTILWRIVLGPLSDRLPASHQRAAVLLTCVLVFGTPGLLLITVPLLPGASPLGVTLSSYVLSGLLSASLFTLSPVLLSQTSPQPLFGRLYSMCLFAGTALSLPLVLQFGFQYDSRAVRVNGTVTCAGQACYLYGNIANSTCHFASMVCLLGLAALLRWRARGGN